MPYAKYKLILKACHYADDTLRIRQAQASTSLHGDGHAHHDRRYSCCVGTCCEGGLEGSRQVDQQAAEETDGHLVVKEGQQYLKAQ